MKKVVEDFVPQGGKHCITNALKQIFTYYGYPISEEMLFGLASGLSFLYLNQSNSPMVSGRIKVFEFEKKLAQRLNITIKCKSGKLYSRIHTITKDMIDANKPVLIYADMPYLKYLQMDINSHFGGHAVVLFGYDELLKRYWVSDRDNNDFSIRIPSGEIARDYHYVTYHDMEMARSSSYKPFPANNKYLIFDFDGYQQINKAILQEAIRETCDIMLNPPAQLLGMNGIKKFAKEILKWNQFSKNKLQLAGTTNYFQISKDGGTGGGIFRKMYGEFLIEAAPILKDEKVKALGQKFIEVSRLWDEISEDMWELSLYGNTALLYKMSSSITKIYEVEKDLYLKLKEIMG